MSEETQNKKPKIKLGDRVRDVYTGFSGTAICRTEWLHGCARIGIEPTELKGRETDRSTLLRRTAR